MAGCEEKPPIGVVIPGYGHPQFLAEAIISACEQELDRPHKVVVVDDGCKFVETGQIVSQLMAKYPGTLHYFRQKNTGLPGARNAGVRFLMALEPELDSVYFLDADNRIAPYSLQAFREALGDDDQIGWAYPDISMFGLSGNEDGFDTRETAPVYSKLKHLVGNISEAGSLVRADLFRSGVFYDEGMTSGFEDWDFWLGALEAGYVGCPTRHSGFLYRRRPESMLADSRRLETSLITRIREAHKTLYSPKNIMVQAHMEAPDFAIFITGGNDVLLTSDPKCASSTLSLSSFRDKAHKWAQQPRENFFPEYLIVISPTEWERVQENPSFLRWVFWCLQEKSPAIASVYLTGGDKFEAHSGLGLRATSGQNANFVYMQTGLLRDALLESMEGAGLEGALTLPDAGHVEISVPILSAEECSGAPDAARPEQLAQFVADMLPVSPISSHRTRRYAGPSCLGMRQELINEICACEGRLPFPVCTTDRRAMIFVSAEHVFNTAATKCLMGLLQRLKVENHETLVVLEMMPGFTFEKADMSWSVLADDIVPLRLSGNELDYKVYLGRRLPIKVGFQAREDIKILARSCDVLLSCGASAGLEALGEAKTHGAVAYVWLDPAFLLAERPLACHANLLAFEHAISVVVTDDTDQIPGLSAEGFPPSKFQSPTKFWQDFEARYVTS